jgi:hypothetical protein
VHRHQVAPLLIAEPDQRVEWRLDLPGGHLGALPLQQRRDPPDMVQPDRARVVDQDVDRAHLALDTSDRRIDRGAIADVDLGGQPVADRLDHLLRGRQGDVKRGDPGSLGGEPVTDRLADTGGTAGDGGHLAFEPHRHLPPLCEPASASGLARLLRQARNPPSIGITAPVRNAASSEARKQTSFPTSSGVPRRPLTWGAVSSHSAAAGSVAFSTCSRAIGVSIAPGA